MSHRISRRRPDGAAAVASVVLALAASALLSRPAAAQWDEGTRLGVSAGIAGAEASGTGVYVSALVDHRLAARGRSVRTEASLGYWPSAVVAEERDDHLWAFGSALVQELGQGAVRPYALLGAALYISDEREPLGGLNGGAGVRIRAGGSAVIAEARVHRRLAPLGGRLFVPLTVGITF